MEVKFKRITRGLSVPRPQRATGGAAGLDVYAAEGVVNIPPGDACGIGIGFSAAVPAGYEIQVRPRSGLAFKHGVTVLNSPGTIDSDYRGEIKVILINHGAEPFQVRRGDRIAQLVLAPVIPWEVIEVDELDETERGERGFGSTGV